MLPNVFNRKKKIFNGYCGMFAGFNTYANLCSFWGMTYEYNILLINNPHPLPEPHRPKIHESLACRLDHTYPSSNRLPQAHGVTRCFWRFFPLNMWCETVLCAHSTIYSRSCSQNGVRVRTLTCQNTKQPSKQNGWNLYDVFNLNLIHPKRLLLKPGFLAWLGTTSQTGFFANTQISFPVESQDNRCRLR